MSFFDNVGKIASDIFGEVKTEDVTQAASDHVASLDPSDLADHLQQSVGTMDQSSLMALGQHLLQEFGNHPSFDGDGAAAASAAGTSQDEVASGSPSAVSSLIDYARSNPAVLQQAAQAFVQRNPEALKQLAPDLLSGIMARISGKQP
jgi:hypothetical protein